MPWSRWALGSFLGLLQSGPRAAVSPETTFPQAPKSLLSQTRGSSVPLDEMLRGFRRIPFLAIPVIPRAQHCQSLGDPLPGSARDMRRTANRKANQGAPAGLSSFPFVKVPGSPATAH